MDLAWIRRSFAWGLLGKLCRVCDVAMLVAVTDDDHSRPMIAAHADGRRFGVFR
jgi:hypothetical protein